MSINSYQSIAFTWAEEAVRNIDNFAHNLASLAQRDVVPGMPVSQRVPMSMMRSISLLRHVTVGLIESHGELSEAMDILPSLMLEAIDMIYTSEDHVQFQEFSFLLWLRERDHAVHTPVISMANAALTNYVHPGLLDGSYYNQRIAQQISN